MILLLSGVPILLSFIALFLHFDLTDESYYLYHFINPEHVSINFYHALLSPIGKLWDHQILGYRLLNFGIVLSSSIFYAREVQKKFELKGLTSPLVAWSLIYFSSLTTISYNSLIFTLYLVFFTLILRRQSSLVEYLVYPILIFIAFSCRSTQLIILSSFLVIFGYLIHNRIFWKPVVAAFIICTLVVLSNKEYFKASYLILKAHSDSTHSKIIYSYAKALFDVFIKYFIVWGSLHLLLKKYLPKYEHYLYLLSLLVIFFSGFDAMKCYKLLLALILIRFLEIQKSLGSINNRLILFFGSFTMLVLPIGTNNNLIHSSFLFIGLSVPFIYYLFKDLHGVSPNSFSIMSGLVVSYFLVTSILFPYRNPPLFESNLDQSNHRYLKGIWVSRLVNRSIKAVSDLPIQKNVKVFGYKDLPFLSVFSQARAYGTSWYFSGYKNTNILDCTFINLEDDSQHIYIALTETVPMEVKNCLLKKKVSIQPINAGSITTWFSKNESLSINFKTAL